MSDNDNKWVQVSELSGGITGYTLPESSDLAGKTIRVFPENEASRRYCFRNKNTLDWEPEPGPVAGDGSSAPYRATTLREGIYLVDFVKPGQQGASVSMVLDFNAKTATLAEGRLPGKDESRVDLYTRIRRGGDLTGVTARFLRATIDTPFTPDAGHHTITRELIGKRIRYVYSETDAYEHIYLNDAFYTWHCLSGVEKGLADTDRCHYYKIDEALYLFVWREKIVPTLGVVLLDTNQMKTTGKLFGYESDDFGKMTNIPIGAHADLLNVTNHD